MSLFVISFFCDGEGARRISIIYWLIDSLTYLSKMFMDIKNSSRLREILLLNMQFPVAKITKETPK